MVIKVIILVAVIALASSLGFAQGRRKLSKQLSKPEQEIEKLERQRLDAYLKLDASALNRIMSDDYTSVYSNGQVITKAQELKGLRSASPDALSHLSATIDQLSVRHFGTSAVLSGTLTIKGTLVWFEKETTINAAFRYTAVYAKKPRQWQIVFSQFTSIEPPSDDKESVRETNLL